MTYLLQTLISMCNAILVLEFASTDCIYLHLPVRAKNGIALLPCIYELTIFTLCYEGHLISSDKGLI